MTETPPSDFKDAHPRMADRDGPAAPDPDQPPGDRGGSLATEDDTLR